MKRLHLACALFVLGLGGQHAWSGTVTENTAGLSADQRCFVAWTQMWAFKARSERLRFLVSVDVHAIAPVRAVAPLPHLDAFHEAFGTRPGDAMWREPQQRVVIW